jgi:hypothetical protein
MDVDLFTDVDQGADSFQTAEVPASYQNSNQEALDLPPSSSSIDPSLSHHASLLSPLVSTCVSVYSAVK